jgi:hypothetical protein
VLGLSSQMIFADKHNPFDVGERRAMWFTRKAIQFAVAACERSVPYHLMRGLTYGTTCLQPEAVDQRPYQFASTSHATAVSLSMSLANQPPIVASLLQVGHPLLAPPNQI